MLAKKHSILGIRTSRKKDGSWLQIAIFFSKKDLRLIDTPKAEKLFEQEHFVNNTKNFSGSTQIFLLMLNFN